MKPKIYILLSTFAKSIDKYNHKGGSSELVPVFRNQEDETWYDYQLKHYQDHSKAVAAEAMNNSVFN